MEPQRVMSVCGLLGILFIFVAVAGKTVGAVVVLEEHTTLPFLVSPNECLCLARSSASWRGK